MKRIIILLIASLTLISFNNTSETDFNIVGKWQAQDENEVGFIVFQKDGFAYFEIGGEILGGKEFEMDGKRGNMTYEVDYSKEIISIDLIVTIIDENKSKRLLCIAQRLNDDEINFTIGFNEIRPTDFENNDSMIFKRVKS